MHVVRVGVKRTACMILGGKAEGIRPLARSKRRPGIILKWILREIKWCVDWIRLAQDRDL
jgi:hypothetical protein